MYPYLQITSVIRATILRGKYVPGQQMPPIRTLAEMEECNPATVQKALKILDVWFPPAMLEQYDGPSYTLADMRKYLNVYNRPILGTIIKPKMGLTSAEYAEVCYDFWV